MTGAPKACHDTPMSSTRLWLLFPPPPPLLLKLLLSFVATALLLCTYLVAVSEVSAPAADEMPLLPMSHQMPVLQEGEAAPGGPSGKPGRLRGGQPSGMLPAFPDSLP